VITRTFDAPRSLVWAAFTDPKHVPNWHTGPDGFTMPVCEIDLRPGGSWRYVWRNAHGREFGATGTYREVDPPKRIVYATSVNGEEQTSTTTFTEENRMKIKLTTIYVDNMDNALRFYTDVLGLVKKADFSKGPYRWLTVASPEEPNGTELQLALNDNPAGRAYQQALYQQGQPAVMFFTDDVKGDYERIKTRGGDFTMPPTEVTGSTIAQLNDSVGNRIQITQLARW
jgi:uncharacterized protein YndB with AHSA1/START domain